MSQYEKVKKIVLQALAVDQTARRAILDEACAGDGALRAQVESLLAHEDVSGFLTEPIRFPAENSLDLGWSWQGTSMGSDPESETSQDNGSPAPERIDRYRILRCLGAGGMGDIYLAEQADPQRKVALKLIRRGMDSDEVVARFEAERQALAKMDHPNVAKVFDAGSSEDGRPFFVLEFVEGEPITRHCDHKRLGIRQRLELFIKVCDAVQHAHQKGIIHRDIKPSNILVACGDEGPVPKVIDFGVAKAVEHCLAARTLLTEQGQLIGTPEYMSPEQAGLTDEGIDTRTDIYSLGVLLYELLAGVLPFDSRTSRRACFDDMHRLNRNQEALKPSSRLRETARFRKNGADSAVCPTAGSRIADIARSRCTDPAALRRLISGDLDWITMKAMEKDRTRRYANASDLAADIRRYLNHEPVLAHAPGRIYRLRKFVRRNRLGVGAGAVVAVVLVAATALSIAQRRAAEQARRIAEQRGDQLQAVVELQSSIISQIDAEAIGASIFALIREETSARHTAADAPAGQVEADGRMFDELTSRINPTDIALRLIDENILAGAVRTLETEHPDQPRVEAELRLTIGSTYRELGLYDKAKPQVDRALEICRRHLGEDHSTTMRALNDMGVLLQEMGRQDEAFRMITEVLERRRRVQGDEAPETLNAINNRGFSLYSMGRYDEALKQYREALEGQRRVLGDDDPSTLDTMSNLGVLLQSMGRHAEALQICRQAREGYGRVLGEDAVRTQTAINNMGGILARLGRRDEALACYRESLEGRRRVLGNHHPSTLGSINNVGYMLSAMGRYQEALPYYREALERTRHVLGDDHAHTLTAVNNLGVLLRSMGHYPESLEYSDKALEGLRRVLGGDHPKTLAAMCGRGILLRLMGRYSEALPYARDAMEDLRRVLGNSHPVTLTAISSYGALLGSMGNLSEAVAYSREALKGCRSVLGDEHPLTLQAMNTRAWLLRLSGEPSEAEELYSKSLEATKRTQGENHLHAALPLVGLAELYLDKLQPAEAQPLIQEALAILQAALPAQHADIAYAQSVLGECLALRGDYNEAEKLLVGAYERLKAIQGDAGFEAKQALERVCRFCESAFARSELTIPMDIDVCARFVSRGN